MTNNALNWKAARSAYGKDRRVKPQPYAVRKIITLFHIYLVQCDVSREHLTLCLLRCDLFERDPSFKKPLFGNEFKPVSYTARPFRF